MAYTPATPTRSQQIAARKARDARLQACTEALRDERGRLNLALRDGAVVTVPNGFGIVYRLAVVDQSHWYHCAPVGADGTVSHDPLRTRSFAGCNDGTWAGLLAAAGVARHPLFAEGSRS